MNKISIIISLILFCIIAFFSNLSFAECPDGKTEVYIVTPSGKEKIICVSDNAIPGIENAADHSATTIVPAACPCWTEKDLEYTQSFDEYFYCDEFTDIIICLEWCPDYYCKTETEKTFVLGSVPGDKGLICQNKDVSLKAIPITQEQYDACLLTMKPYYVEK